jgi:hypothetical protein
MPIKRPLQYPSAILVETDGEEPPRKRCKLPTTLEADLLLNLTKQSFTKLCDQHRQSFMELGVCRNHAHVMLRPSPNLDVTPISDDEDEGHDFAKASLPPIRFEKPLLHHKMHYRIYRKLPAMSRPLLAPPLLLNVPAGVVFPTLT